MTEVPGVIATRTRVVYPALETLFTEGIEKGSSRICSCSPVCPSPTYIMSDTKKKEHFAVLHGQN